MIGDVGPGEAADAGGRGRIFVSASESTRTEARAGAGAGSIFGTGAGSGKGSDAGESAFAVTALEGTVECSGGAGGKDFGPAITSPPAVFAGSGVLASSDFGGGMAVSRPRFFAARRGVAFAFEGIGAAAGEDFAFAAVAGAGSGDCGGGGAFTPRAEGFADPRGVADDSVADFPVEVFPDKDFPVAAFPDFVFGAGDFPEPAFFESAFGAPRPESVVAVAGAFAESPRENNRPSVRPIRAASPDSVLEGAASDRSFWVFLAM